MKASPVSELAPMTSRMSEAGMLILPRDQRLSRNFQEVEDEHHMLSRCIVLADLRADLPVQTLSLLTLENLQ